ncbi:MAG: hypothetical protein ABI779_24485 [Acidobacteriota bacterium]
MNRYRAASCAGLIGGFAIATLVYGQVLPRRTECFQWDQAYGQMVLFSVIGAAITATVLGLTIGLLFGRHFWWAASPRKRIWVAALLVVYPLAEFIVVLWPRIFGFGRLLFSSIDARYADCQAMAFSAPGLLGGIIGQGVAAYGQWQVISALLLGACAVGGLLAWILSELFVRALGLERIAQGGEA